MSGQHVEYSIYCYLAPPKSQFLYICVYMIIYVSAWVCISCECTWIFMCGKARGQAQISVLMSCPLVFWRQGLSILPGTQLMEAGQWAPEICLPLPVSHAYPLFLGFFSFLCLFWDLSSGPHICTVSHLLIDLSPQPNLSILNCPIFFWLNIITQLVHDINVS